MPKAANKFIETLWSLQILNSGWKNKIVTVIICQEKHSCYLLCKHLHLYHGQHNFFLSIFTRHPHFCLFIFSRQPASQAYLSKQDSNAPVNISYQTTNFLSISLIKTSTLSVYSKVQSLSMSYPMFIQDKFNSEICLCVNGRPPAPYLSNYNEERRSCNGLCNMDMKAQSGQFFIFPAIS